MPSTPQEMTDAAEPVEDQRGPASLRFARKIARRSRSCDRGAPKLNRTRRTSSETDLDAEAQPLQLKRLFLPHFRPLTPVAYYTTPKWVSPLPAGLKQC